MGDRLISRSSNYTELLRTLKERIHSAQARAALSVNRELVLLYWQIGREILNRQATEQWGTKVIDRLSADLRREFPDMQGFSPRNLKYMRAFAEAYPDKQFVQQAAAQIPWFHNCVLLNKLHSHPEREWYIRKTIEHGWSRNILVLQIENDLYLREGKAVSNFQKTLPHPQSDLAQQTLKDPYIFDFLSLGKEAHERVIEKELINHITKFLLELGAGFAFVGKQYHIEVSAKDFFIDLLFYHTRLHCYVAVELKAGEFKPEYAGQINFYLSALDDIMKATEDNPSIGLILCATKDKVLAEYALRDMKKPIIFIPFIRGNIILGARSRVGIGGSWSIEVKPSGDFAKESGEDIREGHGDADLRTLKSAATPITEELLDSALGIICQRTA